ncbi:hypothetical protein EPN90_01615 [Patescibacteria group bacterium]|nr:MAG: hypothetical protein EPN90_01615 [Patescibacteria group bacterium]
MAFRCFNLPADFTLFEAARLFFLRRRADREWLPLAELELRFAERSRPSREAVELESVKGPGLSDADCALLVALDKEQERVFAPDAARALPTPRRLPEFVRGTHLGFAAEAAERRQLLLDVQLYLDAAAKILRREPERDALDFPLLREGYLQSLLSPARRLAEDSRTGKAALRAFYRLEEEERAWRRAVADLARAKVESRDILRVIGRADGLAAPEIKPGLTVVIGRSSEPRFVAAARREKRADVVIQLPWCGRRILVVGNAVGLLHVALGLRLADSRRRSSAALPEVPEVFALAESGMTCGNIGASASSSALQGEELLARTLLLLDAASSPALAALRQGGRGQLRPTPLPELVAAVGAAAD